MKHGLANLSRTRQQILSNLKKFGATEILGYIDPMINGQKCHCKHGVSGDTLTAPNLSKSDTLLTVSLLAISYGFNVTEDF